MKTFIFQTILFLINVAVVWYAWGKIMVPVFHLPALEYEQAMWLVVIGNAITYNAYRSSSIEDKNKE